MGKADTSAHIFRDLAAQGEILKFQPVQNSGYNYSSFVNIYLQFSKRHGFPHFHYTFCAQKTGSSVFQSGLLSTLRIRDTLIKARTFCVVIILPTAITLYCEYETLVQIYILNTKYFRNRRITSGYSDTF